MEKPSAAVRCGIDNIVSVSGRLGGASVGLVTGPTGVTRTLRRSSDVIASLCRLQVLFSPEHGLRGERQAGEGDSDYTRSPAGFFMRTWCASLRRGARTAAPDKDAS